jgi:hypothetical protein
MSGILLLRGESEDGMLQTEQMTWLAASIKRIPKQLSQEGTIMLGCLRLALGFLATGLVAGVCLLMIMRRPVSAGIFATLMIVHVALRGTVVNGWPTACVTRESRCVKQYRPFQRWVIEGQDISIPCPRGGESQATEWFKVKTDLSLQSLAQSRCDWCHLYLDIKVASKRDAGFYTCMVANHFMPDANVQNVIQSGGYVESVIHLQVLKPGEIFGALELTRPFIEGRVNAVLGILEDQIYDQLNDFWIVLEKFASLKDQYELIRNQSEIFHRDHKIRAQAVFWTSWDILWGCILNICIYLSIILGEYVPVA